MPQNYTITAVEDTTFDPDNYGNRFYSIRLEGEQNSVLWKTKQRPQLGPVYGHIEPSKSGKSRIFKKDKPEEGYAPSGPSGAVQGFSKPNKKSDDERSDDIRWGLCLKEASGYVTKWHEHLAADEWAIEVNEYANALWKLSAGPNPTDTSTPKDVLPDDDEISLADIPF